MNELLLEPLKYYETIGKAQHEENVTNYFEELLAASGVNREENRATVKAYQKEMAAVEANAKKLRKYKLLRVLCIVMAILGGILALGGIFTLSEEMLGGMLMAVGGAAMLVTGILITVKKLKHLIRDTDAIVAKHQAAANTYMDQAVAQMQPLNALFSENDTFRLIEKTVPEFSFDRNYTKAHEDLMISQYDYLDFNTAESSVTETLAGRFSGNPFVYCRRRIHRMGVETYHGTLVIHWTETYRDSNGNTQTRHRTQTLHASVTKPKPYYSSHCQLCYGNQAAPDLNFTRDCEHVEQLSEKARDRKVRRGEKRLQRQAKRATKKGSNFQEMANSEFDVLFDARDRDHEVQFRLMYTPLAQKNTVALLTSPVGYGDDFHFHKHRRFNVISSEHAQSWEMDTSPLRYYSYDVDDAKQRFISFNTSYFKSVFFDFAPLLSVPAYMESPSIAMEMPEGAHANYSYYEHEATANALGESHFAHPASDTPAILKTELLSSDGNGDRIAVTAYSYASEPRVDFVPVLGGDGHVHAVPVPWVEYIPVSRTATMQIDREDGSEPPPDKTPKYHGILARILA